MWHYSATIAWSSNGRTFVSGTKNRGSIPCRAAFDFLQYNCIIYTRKRRIGWEIYSTILVGWVVSFTFATVLAGGDEAMTNFQSSAEGQEVFNLEFPKQGFLGSLGDAIMYPIMFATSGAFEAPQRTHFWNNHKFNAETANALRNNLALHCPGLYGEVVRTTQADVRFHLPIIGGWKKYLVLEPTVAHDEWYVGWLTSEGGGVSMIPLDGKVRLLIGPDDVHFFWRRQERKTNQNRKSRRRNDWRQRSSSESSASIVRNSLWPREYKSRGFYIKVPMPPQTVNN